MYDNKAREYAIPPLGLTSGDAVIVPVWLEMEIQEYFRSPHYQGWGWDFDNQIDFDVIIGCAQHIQSKEDFEFLIRQFEETALPLREEITSKIGEYARILQQTFVENQTAKRMKGFCKACSTNHRMTDFDVCTACRKKYQKEEQRVRNHIYRANKAGTPATLTLGQWIETLRHYNFHCAYCQINPYEALEHHIPIIAGGGTTQENCVPACQGCNAKKHTDNPETMRMQNLQKE